MKDAALITIWLDREYFSTTKDMVKHVASNLRDQLAAYPEKKKTQQRQVNMVSCSHGRNVVYAVNHLAQKTGFFGDGYNKSLWLMNAMAELVSGVFYVIFDGFFTVVLAIISAIDFSTVITTNFANWGVLPDQLVYLINAVGVPQGLSMVGAAYVIRLTMNLFPGSITRV